MKSRTFSSTVLALPLNAAEFRKAVEKSKFEKKVRKQRTLVALMSPQLDAPARIRLWESFHGINLPKSADHRLIDEIATKTALSVNEIRQEQMRRLEPTTLQEIAVDETAPIAASEMNASSTDATTH